MDQPACKLTLVYPPDAETVIIDLMLNVEPTLSGFTTWVADGHGHTFKNATARERVRGRVLRGVLTVVMSRACVSPILEKVRANAGIENLVYWVEPVEAFGRLTAVRPSAEQSAA